MSFFLCIINYAAALLTPTKVTSLRNALETRPPGTAVAVEAWVHGRRVMGGSMAFLTLGDGDDSHDVQAVLSRKHVRVAGPSFKQTVQLAHPGARVSLRGRIERHERGWPILVCERMKLLRCAPVPATVRRLLTAADEESVRRDEANNALMICSTEEASSGAAIATLEDGEDDETVEPELSPSSLPAADDADAVDSLVAALSKAAPAGAVSAAHGQKPPKPDAGRERGVASLLAADGHSRALAAIANASSSSSLVLVEGEVRGRRRLSGGYSTVDLREATIIGGTTAANDLRCVLHSSFGETEVHNTLATAGARLRFEGVWSPVEEEGITPPVLLASSARMLRSSHELKSVRNLLDAIADGAIEAEEGVAALRCPDDAASFRAVLQAEGVSERSWRASGIHRTLAADRAASNLSTERRQQQESALSSVKDLRERFPLTPHPLPDELVAEEPTPVGAVRDEMGGRPSRRASRRAVGELSAGRDGSFWSKKKRPQLLLMAAIVDELLTAHEAATHADSGPFQIVDIGGSKGHLAEHLAERFGNRVNVSVVDIEEGRIRAGAARARRRAELLSGGGTRANLHFVAGDAAELSRDGVLGGIDLVLGLHACGGLSDLIIAHAVAHRAAFAVCTCCFLSNTRLQVPSSRADESTLPRDAWLDDGTSSSAEASATLHALLKAAEQQDDPQIAQLGAHSVNAMRAAAAKRHWAAGNAATPLRVELRSFEPKYSPRNFVVVGRPKCIT